MKSFLLSLLPALTWLAFAPGITSPAWAQAPFSFEKKYAEARAELAERHFDKALKIGRELNARTPDELDYWAVIVDAARGLGKSDEAEKAAQWMLNLRPEDVRGLERAGLVREDLGDLTGAEDMIVEAYKRAPPTDTALRVRLLNQMAGVFEKQKNLPQAEKLRKEAKKVQAAAEEEKKR